MWSPLFIHLPVPCLQQCGQFLNIWGWFIQLGLIFIHLKEVLYIWGNLYIWGSNSYEHEIFCAHRFHGKIKHATCLLKNAHKFLRYEWLKFHEFGGRCFSCLLSVLLHYLFLDWKCSIVDVVRLKRPILRAAFWDVKNSLLVNIPCFGIEKICPELKLFQTQRPKEYYDFKSSTLECSRVLGFMAHLCELLWMMADGFLGVG